MNATDVLTIRGWLRRRMSAMHAEPIRDTATEWSDRCDAYNLRTALGPLHVRLFHDLDGEPTAALDLLCTFSNTRQARMALPGCVAANTGSWNCIGPHVRMIGSGRLPAGDRARHYADVTADDVIVRMAAHLDRLAPHILPASNDDASDDGWVGSQYRYGPERKRQGKRAKR